MSEKFLRIVEHDRKTWLNEARCARVGIMMRKDQGLAPKIALRSIRFEGEEIGHWRPKIWRTGVLRDSEAPR